MSKKHDVEIDLQDYLFTEKQIINKMKLTTLIQQNYLLMIV